MGPKGKLDEQFRIILNKQKTSRSTRMVPPQELDPPPASSLGRSLSASLDLCPDGLLPRPRPRRSCRSVRPQRRRETRALRRADATAARPRLAPDARPALRRGVGGADRLFYEYEVLARFSTASSSTTSRSASPSLTSLATDSGLLAGRASG